MNDTKNYHAGEGIKVFENHDEAKKWIKKNFQFWRENLLTKKEKKVFEEYVYPNFIEGRYLKTIFGDFLNEFEGNLNPPKDQKYKKYEREKNVKIEDLVEKIQLVDRALEQAKIPETIKIYNWLSENIFVNIHEPLKELWDFQNYGLKIDFGKFLQIKAKIFNQIIMQNDYIEGFLVNKEMENHAIPILIEYVIPKNTNGAYLNWHERISGDQGLMMIARGRQYKVTEVSIINVLTKNQYHEAIKIQVHLVPPY